MEQTVRGEKMKKSSLAIRFRYTFIKTVIASIIASIATIALFSALFVLSLNKDTYPADYYEQQIPGITAFVNECNGTILLPTNQKLLEDQIKGNGILYQVIDADGNVLYGSLDKNPYLSKDELFTTFVSQTVIRDGHYIKTIPITENNETKGAVLLAYIVKTTFVNPLGKIIYILFIASIFSPFFYIIIFTVLFSKKFAREINLPLELLLDAAHKIKAQNLDFTIDYHEDNELGRLCEAFTEMQEELKKSLTMQWKMEQDWGEMVAALAHDLKSPLSLILAYSEALEEDNENASEDLKQYIAVIKDNAKKSATLVGQMQYTSDLERLRNARNFTEINLSEFLEQRIQTYALQAKQQGIRLNLVIDPTAPQTIQTDMECLTRIFDNLITNSLQHTPCGGEIKISAAVQKGVLCYTVSDTGCGFSAKDLKKAFHKFYRGDEARQTKGGHSGLGLYIVKQLTEQLGGNVWIGNQASGGAYVTFIIGDTDNNDSEFIKPIGM